MKAEPEAIDPNDRAGGSLFVRTEHLARYLFAAQLTGKRRLTRVLDCACGSGYGSRVLAEAGGLVLGVDKTLCDAQGFAFRQADLNNGLPFCEDGGFDAVVCFETLEHIASDGCLLAEFHRVLRPGGALLLSVPRQGFEPADGRGRPLNPHHLRLYEAGALEALLKTNGFAVEKLLGQPYANLLRANMESWRRDNGSDAAEIAGFFNENPRSLAFFARLWAWPTVEAAEHSNTIIAICRRGRKR